MFEIARVTKGALSNHQTKKATTKKQKIFYRFYCILLRALWRTVVCSELVIRGSEVQISLSAYKHASEQGILSTID